MNYYESVIHIFFICFTGLSQCSEELMTLYVYMRVLFKHMMKKRLSCAVISATILKFLW